MSDMQIDWLEPWHSVDQSERESLEGELRKELADGHPLFGEPLSIVGRRYDQNDVLCQIDGSKAVAIVHLTWKMAPETDPRWPTIQMFDDVETWIETSMKPEHELWS